MKYNIKNIALLMTLMASTAISAQAQDLKGKVIGNDGKPISGVVITSPGCKAVRTDENGAFSFSGIKGDAAVTFKHDGFFNKTEHVKLCELKNDLTVHMISEKTTRYNESNVLPDGTVQNDPAQSGKFNVTRKDFALGTLSVEDAIRTGLPGVMVTNKSGMTNEGSYIQLRGIKSFMADNNPLFVINGVPYLPDMSESQTINGLSRSIFLALNGQDIKNITVLKGAEAAIYGSLAGNGVILIETDQASKEDMDTRISFNALYGTNWNKSRIPLMNANQYKSYLTDISLTKYANQEAFFKDFTFLADPHAANAEAYSFNTNWQDEIMRNSSTKEFLFRVEGGDAIAKYNISLGYMGNDGTLKNTGTDRYNAQINASVLVSRKLEIQAAINTAYITGTYMEQGMSLETNPLLAAYRRSPLLSPYSSDIYGKLISSYSSYNYGHLTNEEYNVSNPLAVVNGVEAKQKQYDLNAKLQLIYRPTNDITVNGIVGIYYNYLQENTFIPGVTNKAVKYIDDQYGRANNSVRVGTDYTFNMFYGINGVYDKKFSEKHAFKATAGFQAEQTSYEYDASFGRNTPNDFYRTMGNVEKLGRYFSGYNNKFNWFNMYGAMDYTYDNFLKLGIAMSIDGTSSDAKSSAYLSAYPAADGVLMLKNLCFRNVDFINKFNVYSNVSITGNSRYASKMSRSYYTSTPYLNIAGIVHANLATIDRLNAERDYNVNAGIETSFWNNRAMLAAEYYHTRAYNVIIPGSTSPILGTSPYFVNGGELSSRGIELKFSVMPVVTKNFSWTLGATLATVNNKVNSLGNVNDIMYDLGEGATLISRVGEAPYAFYGYQTAGVYATTQEATSAYTYTDNGTPVSQALVNDKGVAYKAGDVKFVDQNGDGKIDDKDKVVLGSATPKAFGNFFTRFTYKEFALDLDFAYQLGGKAYNAVRRITESGSDFSNQSTAVMRRWNMEGQVTDIPHVEYGDPRGNNAFSDRWIESTNFLKLRNITLSYTYDKPLWNILQGATLYVSGENLITITNYLGLDPELAYSYSPMMQGIDCGKINTPRSFKVGVNLRF